MKIQQRYAKPLMWFSALLMTALVAGCGGGGKDPILGTGVVDPLAAPTVILQSPLATTPIVTGVAVNTKIVTATFSKAMNPDTLTTSSFTLACDPEGAAPSVNITGGGPVTLAGNVATLPLPAATNLPFNAVCTATITTAAKDATGIALASNFVWSFRTAQETTRPRVVRTVPATTNPGPTLNVAIDTPITAVFSEDMAAATITNPGSFTLTRTPGTTPVPVAATPVTYDSASKTATFHPAGLLVVGETYTATITTDAKDLADNALAGNYVWTFTTVADVTPPTVTAVNPLAPDSIACFDKIVSATFSEAMAPATINSPLTTFTIKNAANINIPGSVAYDVPTKVATFKATDGFPAGIYTATITTAATDLAGIPLAAEKTWNFSADGAPCPTPATPAGPSILGQAATYAIASTAGVTNAAATTINGDVVLDPNATCNGESVLAAGTFGLCDGFAPTLNGVVASPLFPDAGVTSGAVKADLRAAYIELSPAITVGATAIAAGTTLGNTVGSVQVQGDNYFVPGVYQSLTSILITGDVTLDAKGDPNAVFIFQSSSTIGTPGGADRILLVNGAKASNVWWWAGSAATLGTNTVWQGNILASDDVSMLVGATSCGRLFAGASTDGAFVLDGNVVSVPGNPSGPATCK